MYQVGFGDCFLISIPQADDEKHILIDCGVHAKGHIKDGKVDRMTNVVEDIRQVTGGNLALVIATHAHQDHISGFSSEMAVFETFNVGEVWLPWLENPADSAAKTLKVKREALASALDRHFAAGKPDGIVNGLIENATGLPVGAKAAAGASSNAKAMDLLQSGFRGKAKVRYLKAGDHFEDAVFIKGLAVRILAPSRDKSFLSKMDPPSSAHYLNALGLSHPGPAQVALFAEKWILPVSQGMSAKERIELDQAVADSPANLAFALDKVLNNTSLVGLFTFSSQSLLFPGDAQWGNWLSWLDSAPDLLADLTFYKVGHHGSVNATPKAAVEAMTGRNMAAMASTQSMPFPSIPEQNLVAALLKQTGKQYIQSDWLTKQQGSLPSKFSKGAIWIDYIA